MGILASLRRARRLLRAYEKQLSAFGSEPSDVIFIPYVDDVLPALAAIPSRLHKMRLIGLGMRTDFYLKGAGIPGRPKRLPWLKEKFFFRALSRPAFRTFLTNQLPFKHYIDRRHSDLADKVVFYPDPCVTVGSSSKEEARRKLGWTNDRRYVLCFGYLDVRKGVQTLLALAAEPSWSPHVIPVFAGRQSKETQELFDRSSTKKMIREGYMLTLDRLIDDSDASLLFAACDIVWVAYRPWLGMSGVLVQAGMHGRPVIAFDEGVVGWYAHPHDLGLCVSPDTPGATFAGMITEAVENQAWLMQCGERGQAVFSGHSVSKFRDIIYRVCLKSLSEVTRC
jgi:glycosyltransferase involved in cell wall biosynthesis